MVKKNNIQYSPSLKIRVIFKNHKHSQCDAIATSRSGKLSDSNKCWQEGRGAGTLAQCWLKVNWTGISCPTIQQFFLLGRYSRETLLLVQELQKCSSWHYL